jgi:hypothetical protein
MYAISENDRPADRCGIGGELRAPECVRQNDNRLAQIIGLEHAAERGRNTTKRQESWRDAGDVHPVGCTELRERQVCPVSPLHRRQGSRTLAPGFRRGIPYRAARGRGVTGQDLA